MGGSQPRMHGPFDRDQPRQLLALRDGLLLDDPDPAAVPLQLVLLVDRAVLECEECPLEEAVPRVDNATAAEHLGLVHGVPGRVLLPVGIAATRMREHDDARLAVPDARLPGPLSPHPVADPP